MSSTKCGLKMIFLAIILVIIVNGYAKDISGVERGHNRLNEYISHYETLNYDHHHIRASHHRARRSVTKDHFVYLKFQAHGRDFHIRLKRDLKTFSDKLEIIDSNGPLDVSTDHIYEGRVIGDRNSYVFGSILDGVFEGKIITERDAYYVEHAKHYFPTNFTQPPQHQHQHQHQQQQLHQQPQMQSLELHSTDKSLNSSSQISSSTTSTISSPSTFDHSSVSSASTSTKSPIKPKSLDEHHDEAVKNIGFHSVIYKDSHVDDVYKDIREGHAAGCGITDEVSQWMENIQNSAVEELPEPMSKDIKIPKKRTPPAEDKIIGQEDKVDADDDGDDDEEVGAHNEAASVLFLRSALNSSKRHHSSSGSGSGSKQHKTTSSAASGTQPTKKYANNHRNSHHNSNGGGSGGSSGGAGGATDDFKYPYEKYTKEANLRFEEEDVTSHAAGGITGYFYDPQTGQRFQPNNNGDGGDDDWHKRVHERVRRASGASGTSARREDNKNTCSLYIQTDPLIWRHIREGIADHDRSHKYERDIKTREEITSLIAHHVTAVNYIYRNTKFDGRTEHRNIRFEVQRIKIDDDSACRTSYNGPHNAFCNEHMDVSNFLNLHSLEDHSDFCLAYVFTYRDFTGGTLGLAWVASASGASGGICEKYKTYTETVGGQYQSTKRSLNTGIITFVNYNSRVPPKVSQLTLAHEIGHNFGSPHDYPQECRPGGMNGNFIMFASATSGDRPNNSKFSSCSIRNISNVLDVLVGNIKRDCFKVSEGAFCGNKIVEQGEECDCGFNEDECKDKCCYPRLISEYDLSLNSSARGCTRRAKTQCSPSQGPCCLPNSCTFVPSNYHQKCKEETECSWSSSCNGTTAECPEPKPRDDKTKCNNGTALCIKGECSGSICLLWNMSECFLTSQQQPHVNKRRLCELACQNGNDTTTCRSTSEFAHLFGLPDGGISLRPGSPCDNFQGYCDVFLKCRAVDADGPLVRLKNLLLNKETLLTVAQWITENWYIVVLMSIAFIIVMGIFIKCCAVHTPSSNPKKRRARRISETLRAPMNTLRRMRHPHGRSAGPRSIPPPVHDARSHRNYPPDWDRHHRPGAGGGGAAVALPPSSSHASRSAAAGPPSGGGGRSSGGGGGGAGRSSRSNGSRQPSSSRSGGQHGYADMPPSVGPSSNNPNVVVGGGGLHMGGGNGGVSLAGPASSSSSGAGGGALSRAQMPLPALPSNAQTQQQQSQQQLPQQAYYAPKVVVPQPVNYNRPPSMHNPDLYADAYAALGRGAYEATSRVPNNKV
ncbi:disintegrin and metalloproteinase domain-containing protein 10 isoform X2 [Stomoxys calcitrans]|uniref:disintegrin and metalloproteinase domain-containing protein 10 isoform X2 n=1 Tax=Stomoxys calcitrans TaxID=35570 RepID=UPI0027E2CAD0|nr:disintegrin and metalloproteinase domain-containing protein 10 isoform X2 [Stomoxys calcitrans]